MKDMTLARLITYLKRSRNGWQERRRVMRYTSVCGSVGKNLILFEGARFLYPNNLYIGDNVAINNDIWINASGKVEIGGNVIIGPKVVIHSANHKFDRLDIPIKKQGHVMAAVTIEEDVWIAASVIILPGVRIGKGSIIGAGAVVTKDIPPRSIAVGNPAKVIKKRE